VMHLAGTAFRADRLHMDPSLPPERADERFRRWVKRGFEAREPVFVYEDAQKRKIVGFFHVREGERQSVDLSLAAVDPAYRSTGLGPLMYQTVIAECQVRGYTSAFTHVSLNNLEVLNAFTHLGFSCRRPVLTFHWVSDGIVRRT
jgi:ribosomal protein S18 acetylase RimI-like enzyme